jgi:predicted metal-dependent peptidase
MKFSKVIGKIDTNLVQQAEEKLSKIFLDLCLGYNNRYEEVGTGMGGDPLIFTLMYPVEHICSAQLPTAATDGKRYYWSPKFILKNTYIGLRLICSHEAWHAIYMHPQRRGNRIPKLWNIAVDYIVNNICMEDLKIRKMDPINVFTKHLGKYINLKQCIEMFKNPFESIKDLNIEPETSSVKLPSPDEDRELTNEEQKELERREKKQNTKYYYADPDLEKDLKRPEAIYDILYALLPKCSKCGRVGIYKKPQKNKKNKKQQEQSQGQGQEQEQGQEQQGQEQGQQGQGQGQQGQGQGQQGQGQQGQCDCNGCPECGGGVDIFELGSTIDDHMDTSEDEEKLAKRISEAANVAKRMAGHIPAQLEEEIGKLTAPKITWQDIIRTHILKARAGNCKNDWTKFKTKPMFSGVLTPKRRSYYSNFGCLLDTSGSMSKEDMAFGLSQLCSLDDKSEGTVVPADAEIYWDKATKIRKANAEELMKVKIVGRGGTMFCNFFSEYEKHIGKCDFLIVITDMYLLDTDVANMKDPGINVIWLCTSNNSFYPGFGKVYDLKNY